MLPNHVSRALAATLVMIQVLGSAVTWAMDQRTNAIRAAIAVVSGLSGGELIATSPQGTKTVQFNETVGFGDVLRTTSNTTAELLIRKHALITMFNESEVSLEEVGGNSVVHLQKGTVLVSVAASALGENESVIVETPEAQMTMRGGRLKVTVGMAPRPANIIKPSSDARAHLVSLSPTHPVARAIGGNERVEVYEGSVQLTSRSAATAPMIIGPAQAVQTIDGRLGTPSAIEHPAEGTKPVLLATSQHAGTPVTGIELLAQRQMNQVGALQKALYEDADIEGNENERGAIIATLFGTNPNQQGSSSNPNNPISSLFGSGSPYSAALLAAISRNNVNLADDGNNAGDTLQIGAIAERITVKGGPGLLLFTEANFNIVREVITEENTDGNTVRVSIVRREIEKTNITAKSELLRIEGGDPSTSAHRGRPPQETLIVRGLSKQYPAASSRPPQSESIQEIADNIAIPLQYLSGFPGTVDGPLSFPEGNLSVRLESDQSKRVDVHAPQNAVIGRQGLSVLETVKVGTTVMKIGDTVVALPSERIFDTSSVQPLGLGLFSSQDDGAIASDPTGRDFSPSDKPDVKSFVDATITARSPLTGDRFVTLSGGVVLDKGSTIHIGKTDTTERAFQQKFGSEFNGSVLAVLADNGNPAFLKIADRALGVVDGSTILGSGNSANIALLSVLDSRLIGPTSTLEGRKGGEIPPLLELSAVDLEGKASGPRSAVFVKSAVVVRSSGVSFGALDRPLLEASSPILTLANSQMNATGHLIDLAGSHGKDLLRADLQTTNTLIPRDALVRLDRGSTLTVNGNLLNLANGASATVNGYLFSIANGSTLSVTGTLLSLAGNSVFRLHSDAFGVFGPLGEGGKTNTLDLHNTLCAGGKCGVLTDHMGAPFTWQERPIRVSGGTNEVKVPEGFIPFRSPNGTAPNLVIGEQAALLHIESGSELHITVPAPQR